jgi:hypothetical protein
MNLIKLTSITRNPSYIKLQKEEDRKADTYPIAGHDYIYIYIYILSIKIKGMVFSLFTSALFILLWMDYIKFLVFLI